MEEQPIFCVHSKMEKEDYKKFLYIASFKKNPKIKILIVVFSFLGALFATWAGGMFSIPRMIIMWILLAVTLVLGIVWKINIRYKQRVNTDKTGVFGSTIKYSFYKDHVLMENEVLNGAHDLKYSQFHRILECKEFYILYYDSSTATLVRKKDIENDSKVKQFFKDTFKENYKVV